ncbi:predicted protein [Naegleria gruberi]|uniref:Predicted protein n=1 Tax=Naegleria gruberi TaxID=5762 RepID=D2VHN0_NAEGR|nr:uncharacterized protein NAEGRDRAFT_68383 [Naegleria gruberi]EFC43616.1 predicted protein [Naegleria gruberi]|eukprot:XP_002676360.1 predicted protein [Naegleria gruberi strain NEG-M]
MPHNESIMFSPPPPMRDSLLTGGLSLITDHHGSSLLGDNSRMMDQSEMTSELIIGNDFENNKKLTFLHLHDTAQNKLEDEESEGSVMKSQLKKLLFLYQELCTKKMSMERLEHLDESGNVVDRFKGSMNFDESHIQQEKKEYKQKKKETNMLSEELETKTKILHEKFAHLKSLKQRYEEMFEKLENPDLLEDSTSLIDIMTDNTPAVEEQQIVDNHSQDADSQDNQGGMTVVDEEDEIGKEPKTLDEYLGDTRKRLSFSDVGAEEDIEEEEDEDEEERIIPVQPPKPIENLTILSAVNEFKFLKWCNNIEIIDCREFHSKQVVEVELKIPLSADQVTKLDVVLSFNKHYKEPALISVTCAQPISSQRIDFSDIIQRAIYLNDVPYLFSAISSRVRSSKK